MAKYFDQDILDDALTENQKRRKKVREPLHEKKRLKEEKAKVAEENRSRRRKFLGMVIVVILIIAALVGKNLVQIIELSHEKKLAEERLAELEDQIGRLNEELMRVSSDEYIEQQARQQLRMIYPGEVLYVVLDGKQ